jgi:hypothetical protein
MHRARDAGVRRGVREREDCECRRHGSGATCGKYAGYQHEPDYGVLIPGTGLKTIFNRVVPNGYCSCAHSYFACELICSETATYSEMAKRKASGNHCGRGDSILKPL